MLLNSAIAGILFGWGMGAAVGGALTSQLLVGSLCATASGWGLYRGLLAVAHRLGTQTDSYRIRLQPQSPTQPTASADGGHPPSE